MTAQKRSQNIQDTGITMSALDSAQLERLALETLPDVANTISNVQLFEDYGGNGLPVWVIRGVGLQDFNANNTTTAAIYVDDVYQVSSVMGAVGLFDVEQVEILKGPQGGLYGRNTSGGAVTLRSQRPSLDGGSAYARAGYSSWQTWDFEGAGNVRLNDSAALRVAANRQFSNDAWQTSLVDQRPWGEKDIWNARAWLLAEAGDDTTIQWKVYGGANNSELNLGRAIGLYTPQGGYCDAILSGFRDDTQCHTLAGVAALLRGEESVLPSVQSRDGSTALSEPINALDNDYAGSTVIIDHDFETARLTSISNMETFNYGAVMDFDGTPDELGHNLAGSEIEVWSQELRLTSADLEPLSWIVGAYVSREQFTEDREFRLRDSIRVPLEIGQLHYDQYTDSYALYANAGYQLTDNLSLNASLRYTDEEKRYRNGTVVAPEFPPVAQVVVSGLREDYALGSKLTGNVGFTWHSSDTLMLYGSFARGSKSGGFYGGFPLQPGDANPYKEETVLAWELGFKSQIADTVILNAAVFYYDYRDVQGYLLRYNPIAGGDLEYLSNQGDARHVGAELELVWALSDNLAFRTSAGYLDAEISDAKAMTKNIAGEEIQIRGRRPYAPTWTAFAGLEYNRQLANNLQLSANLDYNYRTEFSGDHDSPIDRAVFRLPGYGLLNGSLFLRPEQSRWSLGIWGKNLTDKVYVPRVVFDSFGDFIDIPGEPRSWGIEVERTW